MTTVQASIINKMIKNSNDTHRYYSAYDELVRTCSDAPQHPTVTVSATGTATPPPPSTPTPLGPEWWKERQAEALREQIQIIADQNKTIEALKKQIAEDKEHWEKKAGIDNGYRESNKEIIDALTEHGLYQAGFGGVAKNVRNVALMCVERGKKCDEKDQKIDDLNGKIDLLKKHLDASLSASSQILESLNRTGLRQYHGSLADNVVSVINQCEAQEKQIEALKKEVEDRNDEIAKYVRNNASELVLANKEIIDSLRHWGLRSNTGSLVSNVTDVIKQCATQEKKIEELGKVVRDRNEEIEKLKGRIEVMDRMAKASRQFDETDRELIKKKDDEIESLQKRIVIRDGFHYRDREIMSELRKQISDLSKQIEVRQGFTQQDREIIAARNAEIADLRKQVSTLTKQVSQRDMTISVLNKEIDQTGKLCDEEMRETERLKKELEVAGKKRKAIVEAGNRLRDTLREIRSYNKLLMGEELLSDTAIQLWEDNTTP